MYSSIYSLEKQGSSPAYNVSFEHRLMKKLTKEATMELLSPLNTKSFPPDKSGQTIDKPSNTSILF
jgi:hypothetical protein